MQLYKLIFSFLALITWQVSQGQCTLKTAPYTEDFESSSWTKGSNRAAGSVDTCWTRTPIDNFFFKTGPINLFNTTGATNDHTKGNSSGKYLFSVGSVSNFGNDTAEAISPPIDISSLSNPWLSYWYHMYGSDITFLETLISTDGGQTYTSLKKLNGQQQTSKTAPWKEQGIDLQSYANDTIQIKFKTVRQGFDFNILTCIDDFKVAEKPSCPTPTNLKLDYVTQNTAKISWQTGGATNWQVEYGNVNFSPGNGTLINVNSNPASISGLQANKRYDIYLRDSCAPGDVSAWIGPLTIRTLCNPVFFVPFIENFDGNNFGPITFQDADGKIGGCWRRDNQNGDYLWTGSNNFFFFGSGPSQDHTSGNGDYALTQEVNFANTNDNTSLETPLIITSTVDTAQLTFWYHMYGNDIDKLEVYARKISGSYSLLQTISGQQQQSRTDAWKESVINLNNFAKDTVQIKFMGYKNGSNNSRIAIDDVRIDSLPSCPRPSNLAITKVKATSATFSWTAGGGGTSQLEYGSSGYTPGNGTIVSTSNNPATITGLSANTTYDVYLRDSCGGSDFSVWVGPVTITTTCLPVNAPWKEDFEGSAFTQATFGSNSTIGNCFSREDNNRYIWLPTPNNLNFASGASADHTKGNSNGMYMSAGRSNQFNNNLGTSTTFTTPAIDLTALTVPELSFWYHMYGTNIDSLQVEAGQGNFQRVFSLQGQQQNSTVDPWKEAIIDLSTFANDTIQIRFTAYRSPSFGFRFNTSIDDLDIHEKPTCPKPQNLAVNAVTSTSANVSWTTGGATNWQIEYGTRGFNPGSGTVVSAGSNPFTLTGLSANTAYDIYVRDSCGANDVSFWTGPVKITTACSPISAPWTEDFEGSNFTVRNFGNIGSIDNCFDRDTTNRYVWMPVTNSPAFASGPNSDHTTGSGTFMVAASGVFTPNNLRATRFISPLIDLSPLNTPELSYWYHMYGADIDSLQLEINNGSGWQYLSSLVGQQQNASSDKWLKAIVDIAAFANDTVQLRYTAYRSTNFAFNQNISIDDLDIHEKPACPQPNGLQITSSTTTAITLSWTSGGATNWQIEYGNPGFTPGTGTLINATSNPFTVTGLNASTSYEFYVRDSCGTGSVSLFTGPLKGTTTCGAVTAPIKENFDSSPWKIPANFNDTGRVNTCWDRTNVGDYYWLPGTHPFFTIPNSGPDKDHTSGNGQFLYSFQRNFSNSNDAVITTYPIDVSGLTKPQLVFWYHMYGSKIGDLEVDVDDGSGFTNEWSKSGQQQTSATAAWQEAKINLSSYSSDTITIRFTGKTNNNFGRDSEIAIDDFWVRQTPTCPAPTGVSITSSTQNSLTVDWTSGGATNWLVGYRNSGSAGAYTYSATNNKPFTINGLNPSTFYDIVVKDSCSATDVSFATTPIKGSTQCGVLTAPYSENFDNTTAWNTATDSIDQCWSRNPGAGNFPQFSFTWLPNSGQTLGFGTGPDQDASGSGQYIYVNSRGGSGVTKITGSKIYIPTNLQNPKFFFKYHMYGFRIDSLILKINNGQGWNTNNLVLVGEQQTSSSAAWRIDSLDLASFSGDTIEFRFRGVSTGFNRRADMAIDEVEIKGNLVQPCSPLDSIWVTNIGQNSADVNIQSDSNSTINLSYYEISAGSNADTLLKNVSSPVNLSALSPGTTYVVSAYDSCGATLLSSAITDTFTTVPCSPLDSIWVTNIGQNSADVNINSDSNSTINLSYYEISAGSNTDTLLKNVNSPVNLSALSPGTTYVVSAYDSCSATILSGAISDTFTTVHCDTAVAAFNTTQSFLSVNVDGSATQKADTLVWDFGDGTTQRGASLNASHTYASPGTYTITLTAFNICGSTDTATQTVKVCDSIPDAGFTLNQVQDSISLKPNVLDPKFNYFWDFGDGTTSTAPLENHTYGSFGNFTVTLTLINSCGDSASSSQNVDICEPAVADWFFTVLDPVGGQLTIEFNGTPSQNANTYEWDFDDGSFGTGAIVTHSYATPGLFYEVTLTVKNSCSTDKLQFKLADRIGLEDINLQKQTLLYPNPALDQFTIEWPAQLYDLTEVELINSAGQLMMREAITDDSGTIKMAVDHLPKGVYQVLLNTSRGTVMKKLLVQ